MLDQEVYGFGTVFSNTLVNCCPSTFSRTSPLPKVNVQYIQTVFVCGGGGGDELCCRPYLQEFNTLFLTRFRTYKIATPPQTKTPVKTTFRD
jgi:hypothetical protein